MIALGTVPKGLNPDEALNGNEAFDAHQASRYPLFYPSNNGREGLFLNVIGFSESIVGPGLLGLRIPAAIAGSLTVLFLYLLGKEMIGWRAAIFGSFLLATNFWHVAVSRTGFRAILVPLLLTGSLFFLLRALHEQQNIGTLSDKLWMAFAGGLLYGLGFHSYIAFRITPLVALAFAGVELHRRRARGGSLRTWGAVMAVWWGTALFVALPMALYFLGHPADFSHRMGQLSPLRHKHPAMAIWNGIVMALLQFNVRADSDWSMNISSAPLLLWPVGLLFLLGLGLAIFTLVRRRPSRSNPARAEVALMIIWFAIMLVPTALSHDTSALRTIGDITPVFLLAGWAAAWIFARLRNRWAHGLFLAALLAIGTAEAWRYFGVWAHSPGTAEDLHSQAVETAWMLNTLPADTPTYMAMDRDDVDLRLPFNDPTGREIDVPYTAGIVLLETRQRRAPAFLFEDQAAQTHFPAGSVLVQMYPSEDFFSKMQARGVHLRTSERDGIPFAVIDASP